MNRTVSPDSEQLLFDLHMRSHFMWLAMRYACLPLKLHKPLLEKYYEENFAEVYKGPLSPEVLRAHLAFLSCHRTMLGRSVQPKGPLTNLSPIIGAIRLKDHGLGPASEYLAPRLIKALATGDSEFVSQVKKLTRAPLGKDKNYQIWVAIFEIRKSGDFGPSRLLSNVGYYRLFPNTKEVKDYISLPGNVGAERFDDLPTDEASLGRLIKKSGGKIFIEEAVRGKAKRF